MLCISGLRIDDRVPTSTPACPHGTTFPSLFHAVTRHNVCPQTANSGQRLRNIYIVDESYLLQRDTDLYGLGHGRDDGRHCVGVQAQHVHGVVGWWGRNSPVTSEVL